MAVSITFALSHSSLRSLSSISPLRLPPSLHSRRPVLVLRNPSSGSPAASMGVEAPKKSPDASFLDRKESGLLHFVKYQGRGNDFIMVDNRDSLEPRVTPEQAVKLCNRNFGIGADGVIFALPGVNGTDYSMRIFNSEGSEPEKNARDHLTYHITVHWSVVEVNDWLSGTDGNLLHPMYHTNPDCRIGTVWWMEEVIGGSTLLFAMCGNGVRCFVRFIAELENLHGMKRFKIHTGAGLIVPEIQNDGKVKVDMGEPILTAQDIPTKLPAGKSGAVIQAELVVDGIPWNLTCISMGNPHCITFGTKACEALEVDDLKLGDIGPKFEHHEMFPSRTNTEFVQVFSRSQKCVYGNVVQGQL